MSITAAPAQWDLPSGIRRGARPAGGAGFPDPECMTVIEVPAPQTIEHARTLARHAGLREALRFLNARTRLRYTGVYRFDPPYLRSIALYDREYPQLQVHSDALLEETYCSIVRASHRTFTTSDASIDPGLVSHVARERVLAYCGVPLFDAKGWCFGSLCHFDPRPRLLDPRELDLLEAVSVDVSRAALTALACERPSQPS